MQTSKVLDVAGSAPDFLIFKGCDGEQNCHIVELKDGDAFDTRKSEAEYQAVRAFVDRNGRFIPHRIHAHFCCFNQSNKENIVAGFKNRISPDEAMTGEEFCKLLELNYDEIVRIRQNQGPENFNYFLEELTSIGRVREHLKTILQNCEN